MLAAKGKTPRGMQPVKRSYLRLKDVCAYSWLGRIPAGHPYDFCCLRKRSTRLPPQPATLYRCALLQRR